MSRAKKLALAPVVIGAGVVFIAAFAGQASAAWFIGGQELLAGKTAALASLPTVHESILFNAPTVGIKVSCSGPVHIANGRLIGPDKAYAEHITFLSCKTIPPSPAKCELEPATTEIKTGALLALAGETLTSGDLLTFKPESGKVFAEIPFDEGVSCALEGKEPLKGELTFNPITLTGEEASQAIEGFESTENNSLEIGADKAFVEGGDILLKLTSGSKFAFNKEIVLSRENVGGVPVRTSGLCHFLMRDQTCQIKFENILTIPQSVTVVPTAGSRFTKPVENCTFNLALAERGQVGSSCTDEVLLNVNPTARSFTPYCLRVKKSTTGEENHICVELQIL